MKMRAGLPHSRAVTEQHGTGRRLSDRRHQKLHIALLLGILAVGAVLRLAALGKSFLWIDEITVVDFGGLERTPGQIVADIYRARLGGTTGQHMPLQYVAVNVALRCYHLLGLKPGDGLLRLPFALFGILGLFLFYAVAAENYGRRTGLWALWLGAISFFHVYQSRDATSYAPLIFFLLLNLYGLNALMRPDTPSRQRLWRGVCFLFGAAGAFFTHLSAWLFLGAEGLVLVAAALRIVLRRSDEKSDNYFAPARHLLLPLGLLAVAGLPFLTFIFSAAHGSGLSPDTQPARPSMQLILYQLAHFGWGRGGGRLAAFAAAVLTGLYAAFREKKRRWAAGIHLALLVIPAGILFAVIKRDFFPRYLAICFYPLLVLAALGVDRATSWAADRLPRRAAWIPAALLVLLLGAWSAGPFRVMLGMHDKLAPISRIRDWLLAHVPANGLYIWRNGYYMREIPGTYEVGDRQPAFADYPAAGIPEAEKERRSRNARSISARFPLAPLIVEPDKDYDAPRYRWIYTDFSRRQPLRNDAVARLWAWGLSPHGVAMHEAPVFVIFYNTEEDIHQRAAAQGRISIWTSGPGWRYVQTRTGILFAALEGAADLEVFKPTPGEDDFDLLLRGIGVGAGKIGVAVAGAEERMVEAAFEKSDRLNLRIGPLRLQAGTCRIRVNPSGSRRPGLLVYSFDVLPARSRAGGGAG